MLSTRDFNLPEKFKEFRPSQEKALLQLKENNHERYNGLDAPTGSGKSLIAVAEAVRLGGRTAVLTSTKGLMSQYMREMKSMGMVDIKGKANYPCQFDSEWTCDEGQVGKCPFKSTLTCPYTKHRLDACKSKLVVTNYSYWINTYRYGRGLGDFDFIVCDEAHATVDELTSNLTIDIYFAEIEEIIQIQPPPFVEDVGVWKFWAKSAYQVAIDHRKMLEKRNEERGDVPASWLKELNHVVGLCRRLSILSTMDPWDWVVEESTKSFVFSPIAVERYADPFLFLGIPKVLLASGTISPKSLKLLGIKQFGWVEVPSDFSPDRFRIIALPTVRMDNRAGPGEFTLWLLKMDQIMRGRQDRKGLIHTVSFDRQQYVVENSRFRDIMIHNRRGEPTANIVNRFKLTDPPSVLVSPSLSTGYDFPGDDCRYQIVGKLPWPMTKSKILKARERRDPEYTPHLVAQELVQQCGRPMRGAEDWAEVFIIDDHFRWFSRKYEHLFPKWFLKFVRRMDAVPPPMEMK